MTRVSPGRLALAGFFLSAALFAGVAGATQGPDHKVLLCHNTGSESNPIVLISVDVASVDAHVANQGDFFPQGDDCGSE